MLPQKRHSFHLTSTTDIAKIIAFVLASLHVAAGTALSGTEVFDWAERGKTLHTIERNNPVVRVFVYYIPPESEIYTPNSPADLEKGYTVMLAFQADYLTAQLKRFVTAFRQSNFTNYTEQMDVRYGISIVDASGKNILRLYFNGSGDEAYLQGHAVKINGPLAKWSRDCIVSPIEAAITFLSK